MALHPARSSTLTLPMKLIASLLLVAPLTADVASAGDLVALRVRVAETIAQGRIEHAVILVDDGKIVTIGQDLPIDRGIPVVDLGDWTAMPGLVSCWTRIGMDSEGGSGFEPQALASEELYPRNDVWGELLEAGFTTLGLYPAGNGIPGQAVAVQPLGSTVEDMIVRDPAYLRIQLLSNPGSKKMLRDGFENVDKFEEKEAKRREKWEEKVEKAKKKKKMKDDDEEEEEEEVEEWVPETPDPDVQVFQKVRAGELAALVEIRRAADWLHLNDAIGDEEFTWAVRLALRNDTDFGEVLEEIGEAEKVAVVNPMLTLVAGTRELRNLPAELAAAGADVAFVPARSSSLSSHESLRTDVGRLLTDGLERDVALRALTLAPARVLGLDDRIGSLEVGKDANLVFFDGDPLSPTSRVQAVMIGGRFVVGEVN